MNVLVGMECSDVISNQFRLRGHSVVSCDLKPSANRAASHLQMDIFDALDLLGSWPDLAIFHPVCRYLTVSGYHRVYTEPGRAKLVEAAVSDFLRFTRTSISKVCIENPIGIMSSRWRRPDQIIQPHQFGDDASKATCLWLFGLPPLLNFDLGFPPRVVDWDGAKRFRWRNQTDSGQNRLGPTLDPETRRAERAVSYVGIASAMAAQWGVI